jgi:hypothetical protein
MYCGGNHTTICVNGFAIPQRVKVVSTAFCQTEPPGRLGLYAIGGCNSPTLTVREMACPSFCIKPWWSMALFIFNGCDLLKKNPSLTVSPYRIQSTMSVEDKLINIHNRNFPGLSQLSGQFGFQTLLSHRRSPGLADAQAAEIRSCISAPEGAPESIKASLRRGNLRCGASRLIWRPLSRSSKQRSTAPRATRRAQPTASWPVPARLDSLFFSHFPLLSEEFHAAATTISSQPNSTTAAAAA